MAELFSANGIDFAPLCRDFTEDEITIGIIVFCARGKPQEWYLAIFVADVGLIGWDEPFDVPEEAYDFLMDQIDERGMLDMTARPTAQSDQDVTYPTLSNSQVSNANQI